MPAADAHFQIGNNTTIVCHSQNHPVASGHTHVPGGATDQCLPSTRTILGVLPDVDLP